MQYPSISSWERRSEVKRRTDRIRRKVLVRAIVRALVMVVGCAALFVLLFSAIIAFHFFRSAKAEAGQPSVIQNQLSGYCAQALKDHQASGMLFTKGLTADCEPYLK